MLTRTPLLSALLLALVLTPTTSAQDDAGSDEQPATENTATADDSDEATDKPDADATDEPEEPAKPSASEQWQEVHKQRVELIEEIQELRTQYATATDAEKRQIVEQINGLMLGFHHGMMPKLRGLAEAAYKEDAKNLDAGEIYVDSLSRSRDDDKVIEVGTKLVEAGRRTPLLLNTVAFAHLRRGDYQQAVEMYELSAKSAPLGESGQFQKQLAEAKLAEYEAEMDRQVEEAAYEGDKRLPRVRLTTSKGAIELLLYEDQAPNTVANFIQLIEDGVYNGTRFHRVVPGDYVMGGNPETKEWDENADYTGSAADFTIDDETDPDLSRMHLPGSLVMATAAPDQGAQQFLIAMTPVLSREIGLASGRGGTVFGRVVSGKDLLSDLQRGDEIKTAEVLFKRDHEYKPERKALPTAPTRPDAPGAPPAPGTPDESGTDEEPTSDDQDDPPGKPDTGSEETSDPESTEESASDSGEAETAETSKTDAGESETAGEATADEDASDEDE